MLYKLEECVLMLAPTEKSGVVAVSASIWYLMSVRIVIAR